MNGKEQVAAVENSNWGKIETLLKKTEQDMGMNQRSINKAYLAGKVEGIVAVIKILGAEKR